MRVVVRVEVPGESIERVLERRIAGPRQLSRHRTVGDAADRELGALGIHHRRTADDGKIAVPPSDLAEGVAGIALISYQNAVARQTSKGAITGGDPRRISTLHGLAKRRGLWMGPEGLHGEGVRNVSCRSRGRGTPRIGTPSSQTSQDN